MQRRTWKLRRQQLIPFVLLELLAVASLAGANVIRKEFNGVESTTEAIAQTTDLPPQTILPIETSTTFSPEISKITSSDVIRENQESTEFTTLPAPTQQTTEGNVEILKPGNEAAEKAVAKLGKVDSTITAISVNEDSITTTTTAEISATKEKDKLEIVDGENKETSSDKTTTDVETENIPITTESPKPTVQSRPSLKPVTAAITEQTGKIDESHTNKIIPSVLQNVEDNTTESDHETIVEPTTSRPSSSSTKPTSSTLRLPQSVSADLTEPTSISNEVKTATEAPEKNKSVTAHEVAIEGTGYDITTNEIRNITNVRTTEKRPKQMKDSNMTLPDSPEVWALAGMKKNEKAKDNEQKFVNITDENALESLSSTTATKLLSDWSKIMKEVELNNSSPNSIENTLESSVDKPKVSEPKLDVQKLGNENDIKSPIPEAATSTVPSTATTTIKVTHPQTTPSIEKNQVEYVKVNLNQRKKVKEPEKEVNVQGPFSTVRPLTTDVINILKKITSTTPSDIKQTIALLTEKPDDVETLKHYTTSNALANLIDSSSFTTLPPTKRVVDKTTLESFQTSTRTNWLQKETTTDQKIVATTDILPEISQSSQETSTTSPDYSTPTERVLDTSSSHPSYFTQTISESSSTDSDTSTAAIVSLTSTTISMQVRPTLSNNIKTTPTTEDYSSWVSSEAPVSTTKFSSTLEQPTESNVIDRITEDATAGLDQFTSETSKMSTTTFISSPRPYGDSVKSINETEKVSTTTTVFQNTPTGDQEPYMEPTKKVIVPVMVPTTEEIETTSTTEIPQVGGGIAPPDNSNMPNETDYNVIIAISVSVVGILALILLVGFLYVMRKRQKNLTYGQRCRPVSLDAYSLDNVSIYNSVRRKGALRASKRSYGNVAFDDPSLKHNVLNVQDLAKFVDKKATIHEEFKDVPQITARPDEVPQGCEDKNRYANVIPLPETRVILQQLNGDEKTEYINANYVRGPKDPPNYYIACQAPLESTVADFWRMIWEQNSRVIIMATDLIENGKEKCAEYLPPSMTIDNHVVYGDFQITLKNREVKEKYAVSTLHVKNNATNTWREITHFWYQWPESGVPSDEAGVIAMLLEARSCLKMPTQEQMDEEESKTNGNVPEPNGNVDKTKSLPKTQGPLTVHCSPGTGRTGTIIACDIALRSLETPKRSVDIPQVVYYVRRGRASAVQTKEQYEFIYRVAHMYATKISGPIGET